MCRFYKSYIILTKKDTLFYDKYNNYELINLLKKYLKFHII